MRCRRVKFENNWILRYFVVGITLVMLSVLLGICSLCMTVVPCHLEWIQVLVSDGRILILNTWPIFCVLLFVYLLTNRMWVSFLSTGILMFVIAEVNRFKMTFRDDPFVFSDVMLIGEARNMAGKYQLFLDKVSLCALVVIAIVTVLCFFFFRVSLKRKLFRFVGSIAIIVALVTSVFTFYFNDELYNSMWHWQFGNQWKDMNQYMSRGVIYSFTRSLSADIIKSPKGYDEEEVRGILNQYEDVDLPDEKKVNIISIMLEAYNDFSKFENVDFVEDPYLNFHAMQQQSYSGNLFTNIFAAGTIETERSFLTGYRENQFRDVDTMSHVRYMKKQGYYTEAMHPCYGWFYNRNNVNLYLGFDNFDYYENKYKSVESETNALYHGLLGDQLFFDCVIEGFESALKNKQPYFNFSVTYQNHGPYSNERETDIEYLARQEGYSEAEYNIMNNYLSGIAETDKALKKLKDYVDQQEEPIVLILFGDHNPWLGDSNSVYEMLGIDLNLDTVNGAQNYYETPYLFYANETAKQQLERDFSGTGETISPMFLMNEYFEYIGAQGSAYLNYLSEVKNQYNVINKAYVGSKDQYVLRSELSDDALLNQQEQIEYFVKIKQKP